MERGTDSVTGQALTDAGILVAREPARRSRRRRRLLRVRRRPCQRAFAAVLAHRRRATACPASLERRAPRSAARLDPPRQDQPRRRRHAPRHRPRHDTRRRLLGRHAPGAQRRVHVRARRQAGRHRWNVPITDEPLHHVAAAGWTIEDLSTRPAARRPAARRRGRRDRRQGVRRSLELKSFAVRNLARSARGAHPQAAR